MGGGERWLTNPDSEIVPRLSAAILALGINGSPSGGSSAEAARIALAGSGWTTLPDGGNPNAGFLSRELGSSSGGERRGRLQRDRSRPSDRGLHQRGGQDFYTLHENQLTPVGDYVTAFQRLDDGEGHPREVLWG